MAAGSSRDSLQRSKTAELGETLTCGICYEILLDPVVGNCGHDFCKCCLDSWRLLQRQDGRKVRCPVCRGQFAESFEKLGVCVRLREMVELLFPDKIAARKVEREKQAALQRKRSVERIQQEGLPAAVVPGGLASGTSVRRRVYVRRRRQQLTEPSNAATAAAAAAAAAAAGGALSAAMLSSFAAGAAAAAPAASVTGQAGGSLTSFAANAFTAMTAAANQLQQLVQIGASTSSVQVQGTVAHQQAAHWPIMDVQFTMGWFEPRGTTRSSSRRARAGRRRRNA